MLVVALVHSRLDYGNSVLVGLSAYLLRQLQSVLNADAHLVYHLRARDHITDALISLHWLRAPERILYKMAVLTYKVLHGGSPRYRTSVRWSMSLTCLVDLHSALPDRTVYGFRRSNCQPSAVERLRSQQHSFGTVCPTTSRQPIRCRLSGSNRNTHCSSSHSQTLSCDIS